MNHFSIISRVAVIRSASLLLWLVGMLMAGEFALAATETNAVAPVTAREFYNAGTRMLAAGQYTKAERMFHSALSAQVASVQPPALYNLGETRFDDGMKKLKQGPKANATLSRGDAASGMADEALQQGQQALAGNDFGKLISAYIAGYGARKEVRAAEKAIKQALKLYGYTLRKWQRAADDFQGAAQLNPADTNAANNAALVQQYIARLVDSLRQMQQMARGLGKRHQELNRMLNQLRGRVPQMNAPPGAGGGDEDADDGAGLQPDALAGQKENPTKEGNQYKMPLSPGTAGRLLNGLSLNGNRRLPMAGKKGGQPRNNNGKTW